MRPPPGGRFAMDCIKSRHFGLGQNWRVLARSDKLPPASIHGQPPSTQPTWTGVYVAGCRRWRCQNRPARPLMRQREWKRRGPSHKTGGFVKYLICLGRLARETGLEPAASAVTGRRSNQLSYSRGCRDPTDPHRSEGLKARLVLVKVVANPPASWAFSGCRCK